MEANKNLTFSYFVENLPFPSFKLPFREGDVVQVVYWGKRYPNYTLAKRFFGIDNLGDDIDVRRYCSTPFKIKNFVVHENGGYLLCHIISRDFKSFIIDVEALIPLKVYPLRKCEKQKKKIQRLERDLLLE